MSAHIVTEHVYPPIPIRQFDWLAYFDGSEEYGPRGHGRTEQEAIDDLLATTCKDKNADVASDGGCLWCPAVQGERCRAAAVNGRRG